MLKTNTSHLEIYLNTFSTTLSRLLPPCLVVAKVWFEHTTIRLGHSLWFLFGFTLQSYVHEKCQVCKTKKPLNRTHTFCVCSVLKKTGFHPILQKEIVLKLGLLTFIVPTVSYLNHIAFKNRQYPTSFLLFMFGLFNCQYNDTTNKRTK